MGNMKITLSDVEKAKLEGRHAGKERKQEQESQMEISFANTLKLCEEDDRLSRSVRHSMRYQVVIPDGPRKGQKLDTSRDGDVVVSVKQALEAVAAYKGKNVAVLNFMRPAHPGMPDWETQGKRLCCQSTLYPCINTNLCRERFYDRHQNPENQYDADMIYTFDVTVFKTCDEVPVLMPQEEWFNVDVITMEVSDVLDHCLDDDALMKLFVTRFENAMQEALKQHVDVLIVGGLGHDDYKNDPAVVATAAARILDSYRREFDTVEFAMHETGRKKNYRMFRLVLDRYLGNQ